MLTTPAEMTKRFLTRENLLLVLAAGVALALATIADRRGLPHKWHTAIVGTVIPFWVVIISFPLRWKRWSFWAALVTCLAAHTLLIWIAFAYLMSNVRTFGLVLWYPFAFAETFALFAIVTRLEEKLGSKVGKAGDPDSGPVQK